MIKISCDKKELDIDYIYTELIKTYWAHDRTLDQVIESIDNSLCFGMYLDDKQIGFARIVTDKVVFSYLMDVIIDEDYRGKNYGGKLISTIYKHEDLINVKSHYLHTKDAQTFYKKYGFDEYAYPFKFMIKKAE